MFIVENLTCVRVFLNYNYGVDDTKHGKRDNTVIVIVVVTSDCGIFVNFRYWCLLVLSTLETDTDTLSTICIKRKSDKNVKSMCTLIARLPTGDVIYSPQERKLIRKYVTIEHVSK